jgi:hypothetical protein
VGHPSSLPERHFLASYLSRPFSTVSRSSARRYASPQTRHFSYWRLDSAFGAHRMSMQSTSPGVVPVGCSECGAHYFTIVPHAAEQGAGGREPRRAVIASFSVRHLCLRRLSPAPCGFTFCSSCAIGMTAERRGSRQQARTQVQESRPWSDP